MHASFASRYSVPLCKAEILYGYIDMLALSNDSGYTDRRRTLFMSNEGSAKGDKAYNRLMVAWVRK